jgi:hypothetical protein
MTTPDPLASVRAKLKSAPKPPASKAPSSDPLAAVRARVKAGKGATPTPSTLSTPDRLARLERITQALVASSPYADTRQLR